MKNNHYSKQFLAAIFAIILTLILHIPCHAELTAESYCALAVESIKQEISNLNEFIALAQQYSNNKDAFLQQEGIKKQEFDTEKAALFSSFNTIAEEYVTFTGKNEKAVKEYLNVRPDIKQTIDALSKQIKPLLEQYESLKQGIIKQPPIK